MRVCPVYGINVVSVREEFDCPTSTGIGATMLGMLRWLRILDLIYFIPHRPIMTKMKAAAPNSRNGRKIGSMKDLNIEGEILDVKCIVYRCNECGFLFTDQQYVKHQNLCGGKFAKMGGVMKE